MEQMKLKPEACLAFEDSENGIRARAALRAGVPVVVVSRCPEGRVAPLYGFEGGGARLEAMGVVLGGDLGGPKARIRLMVALGTDLDPSDPETLRRVFEA